MARIFVSYKRNVEPDEPLALEIFRRLSPSHRVFIDQTMLIGEAWADRIKREIEASDFLLLLLSERSIESPMVAEEIRIADAMRQRHARPQILPVRLAFSMALPYELGAVLNGIQYGVWSGGGDTEALIEHLGRAIGGEATPFDPSLPVPTTPIPPEVPLAASNPRVTLDAPEGTMSPLSAYYVERFGDRIAQEEQQHAGYTLTVQGPRQMGKSSLLARVIERARKRGDQVAFIDFQAMGHEVRGNVEALCREVCVALEDELDLESELERHWQPTRTPQRNVERFVERRILKSLGDTGFLLVIDEADSLLGSGARSDFFGMLRAWHNQRMIDPLWHRFSLAMAISTEPAMLIESLSQSPFNVGARVELEDFSAGQLTALNAMHGAPLNPEQVRRLHDLVGGHPYLARRALYGLCKKRFDFEEMLREAYSENGPFGDHLRAQLTRLRQRPTLPALLAQTLKSGRCPDDDARHRLISGGLLREDGGRVVARNRLYDGYFRRVLLA